MKTLALILAAGQGKRMHSAQPKVLQPVGGKAMIVHLLETLQTLAPTRSAVIYGHQASSCAPALPPPGRSCAGLPRPSNAAPGTRCAWRWMRLPRPSWC